MATRYEVRQAMVEALKFYADPDNYDVPAFDPTPCPNTPEMPHIENLTITPLPDDYECDDLAEPASTGPDLSGCPVISDGGELARKALELHEERRAAKA